MVDVRKLKTVNIVIAMVAQGELVSITFES